ncbi:hypothetical protein [Glaciimonas sp. GG7]
MFSPKRLILAASLMCLTVSGFAGTSSPTPLSSIGPLHSVVLEDVKSGYAYFDRRDQSSPVRDGMLFYRDREGALTAFEIADKDHASLKPKWTFKEGGPAQGVFGNQPLFPAVLAEDADDTVFFISSAHDVFAIDSKTTLMHPHAKWEYHNPDAPSLYRMAFPRALDGMLHVFEQESIGQAKRFSIIRQVGDTTEKLSTELPDDLYPQKVIVDAKHKILYAMFWKRLPNNAWDRDGILYAFPMGKDAVKDAESGKIKPLWDVELTLRPADLVRTDDNKFISIAPFNPHGKDRVDIRFYRLSPTNPWQKPKVYSDSNGLVDEWSDFHSMMGHNVMPILSQMTLIDNVVYFWAYDTNKKVPNLMHTDAYHNAFFAYDLQSRKLLWKYTALSINEIKNGHYKGSAERRFKNNFAPILLKSGDLMLSRTVVDHRYDWIGPNHGLSNAYESQIFILDAKTGLEKYRSGQTSDHILPISMMPVVTNNQLLAVGSDMRLHQVSLSDEDGEQQAPKVDAGQDVYPLSGTNINFSIGLSGKVEGDGDFSYQWRQTSGSPQLKLSAPDSLTTRVNIPAGLINDRFTFELRVTDKSGHFKRPGTASVKVTLREPDMRPELITKNPVAGEKVWLKAKTNMPWVDETRSTFTWTIFDSIGHIVYSGEETKNQNWAFSPTKPGFYIATVYLDSYMGRQASASINFTVN